MEPARVRVAVTALGAIAMLVASAWFLDWFVIDFHVSGPVDLGIDKFGVDLRKVKACVASGECVEQSMENLHGMFPWISNATFWLSVAFVIAIGAGAGMSVLGQDAVPVITKGGYVAGCVLFVATISTAFILQPEGNWQGQVQGVGTITMEVHRTWAATWMLLGVVAGMVAVKLASGDELAMRGDAPAAPVVPVARALPTLSEPIPTQRTGLTIPPAGHPSRTSAALVAVAPPSGVTGAIPLALRKQLRFAVAIAEVTRGGIDARREDGSVVLVVWRDVVGIVARRLPPGMLDAAAAHSVFVDIVSTAGSTLRVLPWTRLSGDLIAGEGDKRTRQLIDLVVARCPDLQIDRATRAYIERRADAAQLPDEDTLAAHDARLA